MSYSAKRSCLFTIKQIIDAVCEELLKEEAELPRQLIKLEEQLKKKEDDMMILYRENSQLEHRVKELERDLEILVKVSQEDGGSPSLSETKEKTTPPENQTIHPTEDDAKQKKREYLREYKRNYRKKKREQKLEFTV